MQGADNDTALSNFFIEYICIVDGMTVQSRMFMIM